MIDYLAIAKKILSVEKESLENTLAYMSEDFVDVARYIHNNQGKTIVSGVGKSGFVGRKISSTMNSVGIMSVFVHPTDGAHGDFGAIDRDNDIVIAISQSGESAELLDLLYFCRKFSITVIALTAGKKSVLARYAKYIINTEVDREACPLQLAPTASTTVTMALGDALAMTVSQMNGFTKNDFAISHPAGRIGRRLLMTVGHVMHGSDDVPLFNRQASVTEIILSMTKAKVKGIVGIVKDRDTLIGVVTDGDIRRAINKRQDIASFGLEDIMGKDPKTVYSDDLAYDVLQMMKKFKIETVFVLTKDKKVKGIVWLHDLLQVL